MSRSGHQQVRSAVPAHLVHTADDTEINVFILSLEYGGDEQDDLASTQFEKALWATHVTDTSQDDGGSAYLLSGEAYKRLKARRFE